MLKMVDQDEPAPIKKPRSEAQIASLDKARKKAGELRAQRNVIRENNGISDETDETPTETTTDQSEMVRKLNRHLKMMFANQEW